jgi:hypothetical protein
MKIGPITITPKNITIIHSGSRNLRPFALCLTLGSTKLDPAFAGYLGDPNDPLGWSHRITYLRRRPNGYRRMHTVFGGSKPQPTHWY